MPRISTWSICTALLVLIALLRFTTPNWRQLASLEYVNADGAPSWLNLTLEGNEQRYQAAIRERRLEIARLGGPTAVSFPEPNTSTYALWDLYAPAFSCPFPVYRVGTLGDGGKWICGLQRAVKKASCVIYSMGVESKSSFEQEILHESEECHVYGFDYSVSQWGPELRNDKTVKDRAHFYPWKILGRDKHDANPPEYSLRGIMKELGHDFIDILKIDIEGSEFPTLRALIESFQGEILPFGQLSVEIHVTDGSLHNIGAFDDWFTMLESAGLRPFWTELNMIYLNVFRAGPFLTEWSFINIRGKHALIDDSLDDYP
ncbi:methyltransferase domain-containing protein [Mycena amicta]|nr:methyltransferase domain-containing protein [Mycena amicta]